MFIDKRYQWNNNKDLELISDAKFVDGDTNNRIVVESLLNGSQATLILVNEVGLVKYNKTVEVMNNKAVFLLDDLRQGNYVLGLQLRKGKELINSTTTIGIKVYDSIERLPVIGLENLIKNLLEEIELKNKTIDELNKIIVDLRLEIEKLQDDINIKDSEIVDLKAIIDGLNSIIDEKEGQILELNNDIRNNAILIAQLNEDIADLNTQIIDLNKIINAKQIEIDDLKQQISDLINENILLNSEIIQLNNTIDNLNQDIADKNEYIIDGSLMLENTIIEKGGQVDKVSIVPTFNELNIGIKTIPIGTIEEEWQYVPDPYYPDIFNEPLEDGEYRYLIRNNIGIEQINIYGYQDNNDKIEIYGRSGLLIEDIVTVSGNSIYLYDDRLKGNGYQHPNGYEMFIVKTFNAEINNMSGIIHLYCDNPNKKYPNNTFTFKSIEYGKFKNVIVNSSNFFSGCYNLITFDCDNLIINNAINLFNGCINLVKIPDLNTDSITNFNFMFNNCKNLLKVNLSSTFNGYTFDYMFYNCNSINKINGIDFTNFKDRSGLAQFIFSNCNNLEYICGTSTKTDNPEVVRISELVGFHGAFQNCYKLKHVDKIFENLIFIDYYADTVFNSLDTYTGIPIEPPFYIDYSMVNSGRFNYLGDSDFIDLTKFKIDASTYDFSNIRNLKNIIMPLTYNNLNGKYNLPSTYYEFNFQRCESLTVDTVIHILDSLPTNDNGFRINLRLVPSIENNRVKNSIDNAVGRGWTVLI